MEWTFGDVLLTMLVFFLWIAYIWMFIAVFGDIFRRRDLGGWAKAGWCFLIFFAPLIGILIYMIARPKLTEAEVMFQDERQGQVTGFSAADEISKLADLRDTGRISPTEYDELKTRAIA